MTESKKVHINKVEWDSGTAYDFFASLKVLHYPAKFGLRGAWAAGVRSRLPGNVREFLEKVVDLFPIPYQWVYTLPSPKDATTVLYALKQLTPRERILQVYKPYFDKKIPYILTLKSVIDKSEWGAEDRDLIFQQIKTAKKEGSNPPSLTPNQIEQILTFVSDLDSFGEQYYQALKVYFEVFFSEEEQRIELKLGNAFESIKSKAEGLSIPDIMELISDGGGYQSSGDFESIVLVPSYWYSPFLMETMIDKNRRLVLFASRPSTESLVPGEIVPEAVLQMMKALSDPTRLRIMRYLMQEHLTPAELSRRLRLRPPTLTHHLYTLKIANLVRFVKRGKSEYLYFAKMDSINKMYTLLKHFFEQDVEEAENLSREDRNQTF